MGENSSNEKIDLVLRVLKESLEKTSNFRSSSTKMDIENMSLSPLILHNIENMDVTR